MQSVPREFTGAAEDDSESAQDHQTKDDAWDSDPDGSDYSWRTHRWQRQVGAAAIAVLQFDSDFVTASGAIVRVLCGPSWWAIVCGKRGLSKRQ